MRVAIPLFGKRVSPRCLYSDKTLLVQLVEKQEVSRKIIETLGMTEDERLAQLVDLEIDLFICGAIDGEFIEKAGSYGIKVIDDVAADVEEALSAIRHGSLGKGYGLATRPLKRASGETNLVRADQIGDQRSEGTGPIFDCIECIDRICLKGENCTDEFGMLFLADRYSDLRHSMDVTMDIAAETHRKLCRVAEFIYYCIGMEYKHVGVAFCVEMFREAEILTRLLRRFFRVSTVCCKVGGHSQHDFFTASNGVSCNPVGQTEVLNDLGTDINTTVGLCVGVDFIFSQHSKAPTSTLFVKDKSLANNPVSALYSKYYIEDILREI
ncbi:DUF1847 domain-containing protein [Candidatus Poribacteria bacterium]|nr:DUF1847 domain-containing protein [Candidatus Poribacteria bacterium]